jgi:hypothetical protein
MRSVAREFKEDVTESIGRLGIAVRAERPFDHRLHVVRETTRSKTKQRETIRGQNRWHAWHFTP